MSERHPVAAAVVDKALQDFEKKSEAEDVLKVIDYARLVEELDDVFTELPANITLQWAD